MKKLMDMKGIAMFTVVCLRLISFGFGDCVLSTEDDLVLERRLQIINKPAVKIIRKEHGNIIDCVDIYKQPAFDHPLLKNHKIQMSPSALPMMQSTNSSFRRQLNFVSKGEDCPSGTVPIRRTTKEDLIREKCYKNTIFNNIDPQTAQNPGYHYAVIEAFQQGPEKSFAAKANINIRNPTCRGKEESSASIWIGSRPSTIAAGWLVSPALYGDNQTHMFGSWKSGNGGGCFDTHCPGFVQIDKNFPIGTVLTPTSTDDGDQYEIVVSVSQDPNTNDWWLIAFDQNIKIGYWPKELFPNLQEGADMVFFGGWVKHDLNQNSPPMGSGHMPFGDYYITCYFRQIEIANSSLTFVAPEITRTKVYEDNSTCYRVQNEGWSGNDLGYSILFGGSGGLFCGN